ncbi:MAG: PQQ-dependent dehydrogenase, methanol/ethanol family [Hyphomicrobiaceae bacterium]
MKIARPLMAAIATAGIAAAALPASALEWKSVTDDRLLNAGKNTADWLIYGRTYDSQRYSPLDQINTSNVSKLKPAFVRSLGTTGGQQVTPSVNNGIMIIASAQEFVDAVDAKTGERLWRYTIKLPADIAQFACCGKVTKGVALYGDKVYVAALDARMIALDAKTGKEVWAKKLEDYKAGYTFTMAPMAAKGKIMVGFAGGEFGIVGQIMAFDAETGNEVWKASTIPAAGEPGSETWGGDSAKYGGGAAWNTASYDPELGLVYWGTGNPAPWNAAMRPGDNLYTNSMVALDVNTGERKWHFQFVASDAWDYDAMNEPVLIDVPRGGKTIKGLIQANKNGHLYLLDRANGKFINSQPFATVDWGTVDQKTGKMVVKADKRPGVNKPATFCPSFFGGKGWAPMAYNPNSNVVFIPNIEMCVKLTHLETSFKKGTMYLGAEGEITGPGRGDLVAIDLATKKELWKMPHKSPLQSASALTTGGGLVFIGTFEGDLIAADQKTGKKLWSFRTGSGIIGGTITYTVDGKQYIGVVSGYGGAFPLWAGKGVPEHLKQVDTGAALYVFELGS